jgi:hypothetical protein
VAALQVSHGDRDCDSDSLSLSAGTVTVTDGPARVTVPVAQLTRRPLRVRRPGPSPRAGKSDLQPFTIRSESERAGLRIFKFLCHAEYYRRDPALGPMPGPASPPSRCVTARVKTHLPVHFNFSSSLGHESQCTQAGRTVTDSDAAGHCDTMPVLRLTRLAPADPGPAAGSDSLPCTAVTQAECSQ